MGSSKALSFLTIFIAVLLYSSKLTAQNNSVKISPNHVYQSVQWSIEELKLMYAADRQSVPSASVEAYAARQPRHVYFKAREVFLKVQKLRAVNGLSAATLPAPPIETITPGIVYSLTAGSIDANSAEAKNASTNILAGVRALRSPYYIYDMAPEVALPTGHKPTQVYMALMYASQLIDGLDTPAVVPNDVYFVALQVLAEARIVARTAGTDTADIALEKTASGKKPSDVYAAGQELLDIITEINTRKEYGLKGGIVKPYTPTGINPGHVMDLMSNTLAELNGIKLASGITENAPLPPAQSGKTPSDVFDVIDTAKRVLSGL